MRWSKNLTICILIAFLIGSNIVWLGYWKSFTESDRMANLELKQTISEKEDTITMMGEHTIQLENMIGNQPN